MNIKCIRKGKTQGLTDNKSYKVIKETFITYTIINDLNIIQEYKKNRFTINLK